MFYMEARWYDPGAGRFLSIDPLIRSVATPQSGNPYSYTENNPVNGVDPTGGVTYVFTWTDPATGMVGVWTSLRGRPTRPAENQSGRRNPISVGPGAPPRARSASLGGW